MTTETPRRLRTRQRHERGSVVIFVVLALGALIGLAAWATETGRMWQVKSQLQAIADSAALAGVENLLSADFLSVDPAAARASATSYGPQHHVLGDPLTIADGDVATGSWDLDTRNFTPLPGSTNPDEVRAVRVRTRRDNSVNGPVPTILARALGVDSVRVNSEAIGYWGFAGSAGPGTVDLPIAIDCCAVSGNAGANICKQNYCDTISSSTPNACPLASGGTATCLEFHSTPEQNACWTQFDGTHPSINTPDIVDIVESGNSTEIDGPIYVDNGDKVPVISEIRDRFEGKGGYDPPAGTDTNGDGKVDSWVVTLPVVECQNPGAHCGGGSPQKVVGFVCFDIHEVDVTPAKIIKGNFVCPTDPRCDGKGLGPGGKIPGAISAAFPVLVN
jgi:Flp pilus assembly protein TadG